MKHAATALAALLLAAAGAPAHDTRHGAGHGTGHASPRPVTGPADGWVYPLAAPGTYALPPIGRATDARLLDETGTPVPLHDLTEGRITVLAFVYTRCGDICPLASARMADLQAIAAGNPRLASTLRLVSLSFDPAHDSPARMADYAAAFRGDGPDWHFLTASGEAEIAPVLAAYGQPVSRRPDEGGGPFSHLLRVFLIDPQNRIRNVYSADFLDPRLVLNDALTLAMEARDPERPGQ